MSAEEEKGDSFTEIDELLLAVEKLMVIQGHSEEPNKTVMAKVSRARKLLQLLELKHQTAELESTLASLQEKRHKISVREVQLKTLLGEPGPKHKRPRPDGEQMR
jgi:hypothetical protein